MTRSLAALLASVAWRLAPDVLLLVIRDLAATVAFVARGSLEGVKHYLVHGVRRLDLAVLLRSRHSVELGRVSKRRRRGIIDPSEQLGRFFLR